MEAHVFLIVNIVLFMCNEPVFLLVTDVNQNLFDQYTSSNNVRLIYFYKKLSGDVRNILQVLDDSDKVLETYGVQFGKVDCSENDLLPYCGRADAEENLFVFKKGWDTVELPLETVFDVDSVVANGLQLALLRDVPVFIHKKMRLDLQGKLKGKKDLIFAYHKNLGTAEHRSFLEVAFAYQDQFQFALTTKRDIAEGLHEPNNNLSALMWYIQCQSANCQDVLYRDDFNIVSLVTFLKGVNVASVVEVPPLNYPGVDLHMHRVFIVTDVMEPDIKNTITELIKKLKNNVQIVVIKPKELKLKDWEKLGFSVSQSKLPVVVLKLRFQSPKFLHGKVSSSHVLSFVTENLDAVAKKKLKETTITIPEEDSFEEDSLSEEHDDVFKAVKKAGGHKAVIAIPALDGKLFLSTLEEHECVTVVFYQPWDHVSIAVLQSIVEVIKNGWSDQSVYVARINCADWTDVCQKHNVYQYPVVKFFLKGRAALEYQGLLDGKSILNTALHFSIKTPVMLSDQERIKEFISGDIPYNVKDTVSVAILGLITEEQLIKCFTEAAIEMKGQLAFGLVTDFILAKKIGGMYNTSLPAMILFRQDDYFEPFTTSQEVTSAENIINFIINNEVSPFEKLTSSTLPKLLQKTSQLVIFIEDADNKPLKNALYSLGKKKRYPNVAFTWIDIYNNYFLATRILNAYNKEAVPPALFYVNFTQGNVYQYHFPVEDALEPNLMYWLDRIFKGKEKEQSKLEMKDWKPKVPAINFLKLMEQQDETRHGGRFRKSNHVLSESRESIHTHSVARALEEKLTQELRRAVREKKEWRKHDEL